MHPRTPCVLHLITRHMLPYAANTCSLFLNVFFQSWLLTVPIPACLNPKPWLPPLPQGHAPPRAHHSVHQRRRRPAGAHGCMQPRLHLHRPECGHRGRHQAYRHRLRSSGMVVSEQNLMCGDVWGCMASMVIHPLWDSQACLYISAQRMLTNSVAPECVCVGHRLIPILVPLLLCSCSAAAPNLLHLSRLSLAGQHGPRCPVRQQGDNRGACDGCYQKGSQPGSQVRRAPERGGAGRGGWCG